MLLYLQIIGKLSVSIFLLCLLLLISPCVLNEDLAFVFQLPILGSYRGMVKASSCLCWEYSLLSMLNSLMMNLLFIRRIRGLFFLLNIFMTNGMFFSYLTFEKGRLYHVVFLDFNRNLILVVGKERLRFSCFLCLELSLLLAALFHLVGKMIFRCYPTLLFTLLLSQL